MSQVQNVPNPGPIKLSNGSPAKIGTLTAIQTQSVQFSIPEPCRDYQGYCIVMTVGTVTTPTAILQGSLDGGNNWFALSSSTNIVLNTTGLLTGDNAAASADAFQVNGMGAGCIFRFGLTAGTIGGNGRVDVWAMVG
jgi:hypothetical protein